jgi:hypothetical protein
VERTQNVLYIIQRQSERLDVLFCLLYINQLPVSVDRTQNVDLFFRLLYINQPHITGVECTQKCIIYHPTPIGATLRAFSFVIYQSTAY